MFDGVPAQWQSPAEKTRDTTNEAAYVFLSIFMLGLAVPAGFLIWAIITGLFSVLS